MQAREQATVPFLCPIIFFSVFSQQVPADKVKWADSPVVALKSIKNPVEAEGMKSSHIRDAVALCQMLAILEKEVRSFINIID